MASEHQSDWYIVLTQPQQEITTVWRLHELGLELYTPIIRERRPTQKRDKNGQKICVLRPKPMFPGYGFVRVTGASISSVEATRGVNKVFRDPITGAPYTLPHVAVMAVFAKQHAEHQEFIRKKGGRVSHFKPGDMVRIDEGSVYSGLIAQIEKVDAKGRYQILLGMIRHTLPADMVVAA